MDDSKYLENIAKCLRGELSEEEQDAFQKWLDQEAENKALFEETKNIWDISLLPDQDYEPDVEKGWEKFKSRISYETVTDQEPRGEEGGRVFSFFSPIIFKIAAVIVVCFAVGFLIYQNTFKNRLIEFQTAFNDQKEIRLPDSSKVWLNKNSKLSYSTDFNEDDRTVYLSGEAFFEVKKAGGKRFTILSNNAKTEVLGTSFNVRAYSGESNVQVSVVTGKVSLSSQRTAETIYLKPGDRGVLGKDNSLHKEATTGANDVAWKTQQLVFENTSLSEVLNELNNYFDISISVTNKNLLKCRFTGTFENPELKEILEVLAVSVDLSYKENGKEYLLTGSGCK